jgi:hypothetical protein
MQQSASIKTNVSFKIEFLNYRVLPHARRNYKWFRRTKKMSCTVVILQIVNKEDLLSAIPPQFPIY